VAIYGPLYASCLERAWEACRKHPWTFAVPVVLLAVRSVLVALVLPLGDLAPLVVAVATAPLSLILSLLVSEQLAWLSAFAGALVVGPLLHLLFVFRGVLFLEVERTTHAQRLFRARNETDRFAV
jgi:hypothetical protein